MPTKAKKGKGKRLQEEKEEEEDLDFDFSEVQDLSAASPAVSKLKRLRKNKPPKKTTEVRKRSHDATEKAGGAEERSTKKHKPARVGSKVRLLKSPQAEKAGKVGKIGVVNSVGKSGWVKVQLDQSELSIRSGTVEVVENDPIGNDSDEELTESEGPAPPPSHPSTSHTKAKNSSSSKKKQKKGIIQEGSVTYPVVGHPATRTIKRAVEKQLSNIGASASRDPYTCASVLLASVLEHELEALQRSAPAHSDSYVKLVHEASTEVARQLPDSLRTTRRALAREEAASKANAMTQRLQEMRDQLSQWDTLLDEVKTKPGGLFGGDVDVADDEENIVLQVEDYSELDSKRCTETTRDMALMLERMNTRIRKLGALANTGVELESQLSKNAHLAQFESYPNMKKPKQIIRAVLGSGD